MTRSGSGAPPSDVEAVLRQLLPRVRNLVRYLVRGDADVDDISQQALIAIARGLPSWRGEAPVERWADRVTARATFAAIARRRSERARIDDAAPLEAIDGGPGPEAYLARRDVVRALDALPDEQRRALVLHHVMGLTMPEIAEELSVSPETVRSRLRLGMQKMRAGMS